MKKYILSQKEYLVSSPEELLELVKNENSHTRDLSLQEYMDNVASKVINNMTEYKITIPANAKDIVEVWKKINMLTEENPV